MTGKVYLVGAGPGRADYLTVRVQQLLQQAEVLVHDALISPDVLQGLPKDCMHFDVGKRGGKPSPDQAEIDRLLVEQCRLGKQVVRLKSGDPFVFGRTTSEIQALKAAGCVFEVVPGLSSALAAPLLAHIPLTDLALSHSFTVLTAHDVNQIDWATMARLQTLVILMGSRHLATITQTLMGYGMRSGMPIAIIRWASQPQQQVWQGTLIDIVQKTKGEKLSPCIMVVGEVVGLRDYLQPEQSNATDFQPPSQAGRATVQRDASGMDASGIDASTAGSMTAGSNGLPLTAKTVLVTRAAGQSSQFSHLLKAQGAAVIEMPALEITPPSSWDALDDAIARLSQFHWLVLTSANAVTYFCDRLLALGHDTRALAGLKIAVVGKKTNRVLNQRGLMADFIPPDFVADAIVEHWPEAALAGQRLLFPRVESGGREVLVKELTSQGATVTEVAAYESGCPAAIAPEALKHLQARQVDVITFASSKTVRHGSLLFEQALGDRWRDVLESVAIASIGPQTSETCHELIGRVDIEATEFTLDGLTQALVQWASASSD
ncbi:MAG: uroporphyrinogen-III C-methyltransferase [Cyanobacteria bacterium J06635_15]